MMEAIEIIPLRCVGTNLQLQLVEFFECIRDREDNKFFHPHPFTKEEALQICEYPSDDYYCVVLLNEKIVGYGMLRGWAEGYRVPSLGMIIDPSCRGMGFGARLISHLHFIAKKRGAGSVRLKVYKANVSAVSLYVKMGYRFDLMEGQQMVGVRSLRREVD